MRLIAVGCVLVLVVPSGCAKRSMSELMPIEQAMNLLDHRSSWTKIQPIDLPRHPAEKYLDGMTIVLDPGHGGDAWKEHWKRGPTGVREAEINLRVGLLLGKLLRDAG